MFDGNCNPTCMDLNSSSAVRYDIDTVMVLNEVYLDGFREANADVNEVIEKKEEA